MSPRSVSTSWFRFGHSFIHSKFLTYSWRIGRRAPLLNGVPKFAWLIERGALTWEGQNRNKTNFDITRDKVVISRNSVLWGMAYSVLQNGTEWNEMTQKVVILVLNSIVLNYTSHHLPLRLGPYWFFSLQLRPLCFYPFDLASLYSPPPTPPPRFYPSGIFIIFVNFCHWWYFRL